MERGAAVRHVDRDPARARGRVHGSPRGDQGRDVGDRVAHAEAVAPPLHQDGLVEVARARRVDGDQVEVARVAAPVRRRPARGGGERLGLGLGGMGPRDAHLPADAVEALRQAVGRTGEPQRGRRHTARDGEVLEVLDRAPPAAPAPADGVEGLHQGAALDGHARPGGRPVEVGHAAAVRRAAARDVRVLDGVDVDRAAVRVLRPARRPGGRPAVEGRGVVGLDAREVVAAVGLDGPHPPDREARAVEGPERRHDVARGAVVNHQGAAVETAVEADERQAHVAQGGGPDRAARPPHARRHLLPLGRRDRAHHRAELGQGCRGGGAARGGGGQGGERQGGRAEGAGEAGHGQAP